MKIGVLGGIGPQATAYYYSNLIDRLVGEGLIFKNSDYPQIIVNSIPATELTEDSIEEEVLQDYIDGIQELNALDVDFIVMVCNTIHLFHEKLQQYSKAPIVDLRQEVKNELISQSAQTYLVLGTPGTIRDGLYSFQDLNEIRPSDTEIEIITGFIHTFLIGKFTDADRVVLENILKNYPMAQCAILGCTELVLMLPESSIPLMNTIDVLIKKTINMVKEKKPEQNNMIQES